MNLPIFTAGALRAFVLRQPVDRPIAMHEFVSESPCGCVLVHFGREVLGIEGAFTAGLHSVGNVGVPDRDQGDVETFIGALIDRKASTYGAARQLLHLL